MRMRAREGAAIKEMNIRNVFIVTKPKQAEVARVATDLEAWFKTKSIKASLTPDAASTADLPSSSGVTVRCWRRLGCLPTVRSQLLRSITGDLDF